MKEARAKINELLKEERRAKIASSNQFAKRYNCVGGNAMTLLEQIEKTLNILPPDKQKESLDFIEFLYQQADVSKPAKPRSLKNHAAFGSWKHRKVNAVKYQHDLRSEWEAS